MSYQFNVKEATEQCITWIQNWFKENGPDCKAVIGISGGKDSTVAAALLTKALGTDRVFGVLLPNGIQSDINVSEEVCDYLGIKNITINMEDAFDALQTQITNSLGTFSTQSEVNLAPRLRMTTLYAVSQSINGRVCNTCNYSEDYVGYSTRYGDSVGDFSPLSNFTVEEVKAIGKHLGIPSKFIDKTPSDGLCGKTDEDNLGFTYQMLDDYLRKGILPPADIKEHINYLHKKNIFKLRPMPAFRYMA